MILVFISLVLKIVRFLILWVVEVVERCCWMVESLEIVECWEDIVFWSIGVIIFVWNFMGWVKVVFFLVGRWWVIVSDELLLFLLVLFFCLMIGLVLYNGLFKMVMYCGKSLFILRWRCLIFVICIIELKVFVCLLIGLV